MKFKLSFMCIALASVVLGSAHPVFAAPPKDACSLLTPAQVGAALGMQVGAGKALMAKVCIWRGASGKRVTLDLIDLRGFAAAKTPIGNGIIKTATRGIGDDAVYVSSRGMPITLTVKKGDSAFTLIVYGFPDDQTKAKEKTLALDVLAKL